MTKVKPKYKEHYVPKCYLKHFTDQNGYLHIYDQYTKRTFTSKPKSICYEKDCYETIWDEPFKLSTNKDITDKEKYFYQNEIEHSLELQETAFAPVIDKIIKICSDNKNSTALICKTYEKEMLQKFMANMHIRQPNFVKSEINSITEHIQKSDKFEGVREVLKLLETYITLKQHEVDHTHSKEVDLTHPIIEHATKKLWLDPTFNNFENYFTEYVKVIRQMYMTFFKPIDDAYFITSSQPVIWDQTVLCIPLSPKLMICYSKTPLAKDYQNRLVHIDSDSVNKFNQLYWTSNVKDIHYIISHKDLSLPTQ